MKKIIREKVDDMIFEVYEYNFLTEEEKLELIEEVEFEVVKDDEDYYRLVDTTKANLGNIEGEHFNSIDEIMYRLENYWYDYQISFI